MKHRSVITAADLMPDEMSPSIVMARWGLVAHTLIDWEKYLKWLNVISGTDISDSTTTTVCKHDWEEST